MRVEAKHGNSGLTASGTALLSNAGCDMTTFNTAAKATQSPGRFRLPDPPEDPEDKMTSFDRLAANGNVRYLTLHLMAQRPEERDRILVAGEHYTVAQPTRYLAGSRYPDLLVAFGVDPDAYEASNGYVVSEQGKPPDFVLEVASRRTGREDTGPKRSDYAALGILEYWRFDETGEHHGVKLAGERLVNGEYVAVEIEELPDGSLQGYSPVLDLYLRWERGELVFYDLATGQRVLTYEDQQARADTEQARADAAEAELSLERESRAAEQSRADTAEAELTAERARVRELEEQLRRQDP